MFYWLIVTLRGWLYSVFIGLIQAYYNRRQLKQERRQLKFERKIGRLECATSNSQCITSSCQARRQRKWERKADKWSLKAAMLPSRRTSRDITVQASGRVNSLAYEQTVSPNMTEWENDGPPPSYDEACTDLPTYLEATAPLGEFVN
ncbi:unnamed protein product [Lymnaea stagnalis]|uniref:Uncharacterized protein n=1 Tax=Lymnaea stagnalis TaxID=6523 RepID=A0AAV2IEU3_LYMST